MESIDKLEQRPVNSKINYYPVLWSSRIIIWNGQAERGARPGPFKARGKMQMFESRPEAQFRFV